MADKEVSNSPPLRKRVTATHLVAVGVVLIGIVTAVMGFVVTRNQDRLAGCVAGYSNALADTLERRAAPQQEATDQLDAVMQAIVKAYQGVPGAGSESVRQAILDYVAAREHVKQTLKDNPLPDAPRDACRELLE